MSDTPRHTPTIVNVDMVGTDGKQRTIPKIQYRRSVLAEQEAEEYRLGPFAHQEDTKDPSILSLLAKPHLMIVAPYVVARIITATRLRKDHCTHKALLGSDILAKYLENDVPMREGYEQFHQLFLFFGYIDAPNSYLPSLLTQLVGQRYHAGVHVWLFVPKELSEMAAQWTDVMNSLSYLERVRVPKLTDHEYSTDGPSTTAVVKAPSLVKPSQSFSTTDPKLRGPKDKRIRR